MTESGCCCCSLWAVVIVAIAAALYFLRKYGQGGQFNKDHIRMDGKVVIVTGANTGIGKETAIDLAKRGAKVYLGCRDKSRGEEAQREIRALSNNNSVYYRSLDLCSLESVRKFVERFLKEESRLDVLMNNAGVGMLPKTVTKDGFEIHIGVNHMGHFLLTNLLLDVLKASQPSRIVNVSSMAHESGKINKQDLNSEIAYNRFNAYGQSKLANVLFTRHLATTILRGTKVTANSLHPGAVATEIGRHFHPVLKCLATVFVPFVKTPKSGAQTQIRLAVDPDLETVTGKYFSDCEVKAESKRAQSDEDALWLWNESLKWTKLNKKD